MACLLITTPAGRCTNVSCTSGNKMSRPIHLRYMLVTAFTLGVLLGTQHSAFAQGDVWVQGVEITQSIQTYDPGSAALSNRIPLIAFKPTVVRVYVQSREDAGGPWTDVTARLTLSNADDSAPFRIARHDHEPSNPTRTITVSPGGSNRSTLDDSFYFVLDFFDTAPGERRLEVSISSVSGRAEDTTTNNTLTTRARFPFAIHRTVYGVTYANTNPDLAAAPWSDFEGHRRYAESMLPLSYFLIVHWPGNPTLSFDDSNPAFRAYQTARAWAERALFLFGLETYGDGTIHPQPIYLLQPEDTCRCGGSGNSVINGHNNHGSVGIVMAHEIGHWLGLTHVGWIDHPAYEPHDLSFPYTHGSIGTQVGVNVGATWLPFSTSPPSPIQLLSSSSSAHVHDIMSYGPTPMWISPYSYCELMRLMTGGAMSCPTGTERAQTTDQPAFSNARYLPASFSATGPTTTDTMFSLPVQQAQKKRVLLYVSGLLNSDGTATFNPFEMISTAKNPQSKTQGSKYRLTLETDDGKVLGEHTFDDPTFIDCRMDGGSSKDNKKPAPVLFSLAVPYDPATNRIVLRREGKVLAERKVSSNYPKITLVPLKGGKEALTGRWEISWKASDADGDPLTFTVEYSFNGGDTWIPVSVGLSRTSLDIDFNSLPGSDKALIRVLASDGVNTSEARLGQTFRVSRKGPQVTLFVPKTDVLTFPNVVEATAFDWEDGPLTDPAAYRWNSNRDGLLGTGPWIFLSNLELSPGEHTITLTVHDSDKNNATATFAVSVKEGATKTQKK
ncbi:MAG: hypothetical protein AABN34_20360 [Acidobacteriota bacterium]